MELIDIDPVSFIKNLPIGLVIHGSDTKILYANPVALSLLKITKEQALGVDAFDPKWRFLRADSSVMPIEEYPVNLVLKNRQSLINYEVGIDDQSGENINWVLVSAYPEFTANQAISRIIVSIVDVSQQKQMIPFESIVENANDVVLVTKASPIDDTGPEIVYANKAFTDLTGYCREEVIGKTPRILQGPESNKDELSRIKNALAQKKAVRAQVVNYSKDGSPYWLDMNIVPLLGFDRNVRFFAAIERDITDQKLNEASLKDLSVKDPLTKILNRRGFDEHATIAIEQARRLKLNLVVVMLDIDHFKRVNDTFGHDIGDQVLRAFSHTIKQQLRKTDIMARMGGEEFALILPMSQSADPSPIIKRLQMTVESTPIILDDQPNLNVTASFGYTNYQFNDDDDYKVKDNDNKNFTNIATDNLAQKDKTTKHSEALISQLIQQADQALYKAKTNGRNRVEKH